VAGTVAGYNTQAFQEEIVAALEHNLEVWLATVPIGGGGNRSYDMRDLVRFAKTWKLEKATPEEIYARYVDHNVEDSQGWVAPPPEGETAFDISKYQSEKGPHGPDEVAAFEIRPGRRWRGSCRGGPRAEFRCSWSRRAGWPFSGAQIDSVYKTTHCYAITLKRYHSSLSTSTTQYQRSR
jgi:hypothetical protein